MQTLNRILVPVDFSECSRAALEYAAFLGERFEATIDVLHVWEPPRRADAVGDELSQFARTSAGRTMEDFLYELEDHGVSSVHGRLASGDPTQTIVDVARDEEYDLIVMGTHGPGGLKHALLGGVAEKVVRRAQCPVLTISPSERTAFVVEEGRV